MPWLGPAVATLRYVMYFRFYGRHHEYGGSVCAAAMRADATITVPSFNVHNEELFTLHAFFRPLLSVSLSVTSIDHGNWRRRGAPLNSLTLTNEDHAQNSLPTSPRVTSLVHRPVFVGSRHSAKCPDRR